MKSCQLSVGIPLGGRGSRRAEGAWISRTELVLGGPGGCELGCVRARAFGKLQVGGPRCYVLASGATSRKSHACIDWGNCRPTNHQRLLVRRSE